MRRREFQLVVEKAILEMPPAVRRMLRRVVIEVHDRPTREVLRDAGLRSDEELFGWYEGTPLTERSVDYGMAAPDRILLFQSAHESACRTRRELLDQIKMTVRHEVGHYLGMDEEELDRFGLG